MRIVFMGTPDFAVPSLTALAAKHEVVIDLKDPSAPTIEDVYVGDKEVTVNLPNDVEVGDKVRVTLPNGKRVEVELTAEMIAAKKAKQLESSKATLPSMSLKHEWPRF